MSLLKKLELNSSRVQAYTETLRVFALEQDNLLFMKGWLAGKDVFDSLILEVNGKPAEFEIVRTQRPDVASDLALLKTFEADVLKESGFQITALIKKEPLRSVRLLTSCGKAVCLKSNRLYSYLGNSPFKASIACSRPFESGWYVEGEIEPASLDDVRFLADFPKTPSVSLESFELKRLPFNGPDVMAPWRFSFILPQKPSPEDTLAISQDAFSVTLPLDAMEESLSDSPVPVSVKARNLYRSAKTAAAITMRHPKGTAQNALRLLQTGGLRAVMAQVRRRLNLGAANVDYHAWFLTHRASPDELEKQRDVHFEKEPLISIVVAAYNPDRRYFQEMVNSILAQSYPNWQLCVADGSTDSTVREILNSTDDPRIDWISLDENMGISKNTNAAADLARGEWIAFGDHDDILEPDALFEAVKAINDKDPAFLYTDEDKYTSSLERYVEPNLKPDFSLSLIRSVNYISHLSLMKKDLFESLGRLNPDYDGAQDYDLTLRAVEALKPEQIVHIPKPLYHWRAHENSTAQLAESKNWAFEAGEKALQAHLDRMNIHGTAKALGSLVPGVYEVDYQTAKDLGEPLVSVLIPNKDHIEDLEKCLASLKKQEYGNLEIIVIENNSTQEKTFKAYKRLEKEYPNLKVAQYPDGFNFSKINNFGRQFAHGKLLLLLNNDTEAVDSRLITIMANQALLPGMGAVGAKLYYPDGTFQHHGVIVGQGGIAGHAYINRDDTEPDYALKCTRSLSAVTAACLMTPASVYDEVCGLNEDLDVAFNDVDYCMKVRKAGYDIVLDPRAVMIHYESKSRGYEDTPEKQQRFHDEIMIFADVWEEELIAGDPFYNPNYARMSTDHTLRWKEEENPYLKELKLWRENHES